MSQAHPLELLLASDHPEEIKDVTLSLRTCYPDSRIEVAYSAEEAIAWAAKHNWRLILVDGDLLQESGLDMLTELRKRALHAILIVQADCNDATLGMQVLRFGADFCVSKKSPGFLVQLAFVVRTLLKTQDLSFQVNSAQEQLQAMQERLTQTQGEKQAIMDQLEQVRQEYPQLQEQLQHLAAQRAQDQGQTQAHLEELERLRHEQSQLQERLTQTQGEKQALLEQTEQMRQEHAQLQEQLQHRGPQFSQTTEERQLPPEEGPHELLQLQSQIWRLDDQLYREQEDKKNSLQQVAQLQNERTQIQEELAQVQKERQLLLDELARLRETRHEMEERIKRLEELFHQEQREKLAF